MTAADQPSRCEVCRARLTYDRPRSDRRRSDRRRCPEHLDQQPLFPLTALRRPRERSRKATP